MKSKADTCPTAARSSRNLRLLEHPDVRHRRREPQRDAIRPGFEALLSLVDAVLPVERRDAERAAELLSGLVGPSARDALKVAIMEPMG